MIPVASVGAHFGPAISNGEVCVMAIQNSPSGGFVPLSFDDAFDEHLDNVVPILNEYGIGGTFYVHLGSQRFARRMEEWRDAARVGHELGNHTIFHPRYRVKRWI